MYRSLLQELEGAVLRDDGVVTTSCREILKLVQAISKSLAVAAVCCYVGLEFLVELFDVICRGEELHATRVAGLDCGSLRAVKGSSVSSMILA